MDENTNVWIGTTFNVSDDAYSVTITDTDRSEVTEELKMPYRVYEAVIQKFGTEDKPLNCWDATPNNGGRFDIRVFSDHLRCKIIGSEYNFNMKTGKLQVMFDGGYMDDWRESTDTPYVSLGKCEKID